MVVDSDDSPSPTKRRLAAFVVGAAATSIDGATLHCFSSSDCRARAVVVDATTASSGAPTVTVAAVTVPLLDWFSPATFVWMAVFDCDSANVVEAIESLIGDVGDGVAASWVESIGGGGFTAVAVAVAPDVQLFLYTGDPKGNLEE